MSDRSRPQARSLPRSGQLATWRCLGVPKSPVQAMRGIASGSLQPPELLLGAVQLADARGLGKPFAEPRTRPRNSMRARMLIAPRPVVIYFRAWGSLHAAVHSAGRSSFRQCRSCFAAETGLGLLHCLGFDRARRSRQMVDCGCSVGPGSLRHFLSRHPFRDLPWWSRARRNGASPFSLVRGGSCSCRRYSLGNWIFRQGSHWLCSFSLAP